MPIRENRCSLNEEYENMIKEMTNKMEEIATIYSNLHESIRTSETGVYLGVCLFNTNKAMEELCVYYGVN